MKLERLQVPSLAFAAIVVGMMAVSATAQTTPPTTPPAAPPATPPLATSGMAVDEAAYEDPALMLQGKVTGKPRNCLVTNLIRKTRTPSDTVVLFLYDEGWFRSDLPRACPGLGPRSAIADSSFADMICAGDPFGYTASTEASVGQGGCNFGPFSPYELPKNPGAQ